MIDIRWICENPTLFDASLSKRGIAAISLELIEEDSKRRLIQTNLQNLKEKRNATSKEIGKAKGQGLNADTLIKDVAELKNKIQDLEEKEKVISEDITKLLSGLPNIPSDDTPEGINEDDNVESPGTAPSNLLPLIKVSTPPTLFQ